MAAIAAGSPIALMASNSLHAAIVQANISLVKPISMGSGLRGLNNPGRIGFYIDYSELDGPGKHTFYVARTHGVRGEVKVNFSTHGDAHSNVTGTLTWGDGEADIKSFEVDVPQKTFNGEHRIYAQLSNPTGNAVLQFGDQTRAYGVIDDDTVSDNAVFFDVDAPSNGSGTKTSPFNNIYAALAAASGKRFVYGKGTFKPDGTHKVGPYSHKAKGIAVTDSRDSEEDRLIIRAWPGYQLTVDGGTDTDTFGFFCGEDESYHTYKKINFRNLSTVGTSGSPCAAIWYHYGHEGSRGITVEYCNIEAIDGLENQGGISPYGVFGFKVWRCDIKNIAKNGDTTIAAGVLSYDGQCISVQRCTFSEVGKGTYQKRVANDGDISICCRFNLFDKASCYYGRSGDMNPGHSHTIVQCNIFIGDDGGDKADGLVHKTENAELPGRNLWWCNNVFDGCGEGANGAIILKYADEAKIFNNIFNNCRWSWTEYFDGSEDGIYLDIADYNHHFNTGWKAFMLRGDDYRATETAQMSIEVATGSVSVQDQQLMAARGETHAANDVFDVAPGFVDENQRDYHLAPNSPCKGTGLGGVDKGAYLTSIEVIGHEDTTVKSKIKIKGKIECIAGCS